MKAMGCEFSPSGTVLKNCLNQEIQTFVIPEKVKKIAAYAFRKCRNLKKVVFPAGLKQIEEYAFEGCSALKEIDLSTSDLTELGQRVFENCTGLAQVSLPDTLQEISNFAFKNCISLREIKLPARLRRIRSGAFGDCKKLPFLELPASVEEIETWAFGGCTELSLELLASVKEIGKYAFHGCASLRKIRLPLGLKKIQEGTFEDCSQLADINVSELDQLETIEDRAFWNCRSLELILPPNLAELGGGLYGIKSVDVSKCRNFFLAGDGILVNQSSGTLVYAPESCSGVYNLHGPSGNPFRIASYAFYRCSGLTAVNCGLTEVIGDYAFSECQNLEKVQIEEVAQLGKGVFSGCENLCEVLLGNSDDEEGPLTCVPERTFRDCRKLQKFVIPESIETIGEEAFCQCRSLKEINIPYKLKKLDTAAFCGCSSLRQVVLYCDLQWIEGSTFAFCKNLQTVLLPESLYGIGTKAFACCPNLSKVNLPEGLHEICNEAFFRCWNLEVRIPSTVKTIEGGALAMTRAFSIAPGNQHFMCDEVGALFEPIFNWPSPKYRLVAFPYSYRGEYMLPRNVEEIHDMAFFGCSGLCGMLELGGELRRVGKMAFSGCTSLTLYLSTAFSVGEDIDEPGRDRFWVAAFSGVRQIVIAENLDYFYYDKQGALHSRNHGRVKYLPPDFTGKYIVTGSPETIYQGFFDGHPGVTEVILPSSIQAIRAYAFANCENLRRVEIPEDAGPLEIEYKAFANCPKLREVVLPRNVVSIDPEAFFWSPCEKQIKRRYGHLFTQSSNFVNSIIHYYQSWWEALVAELLPMEAEFFLEGGNATK